ncbi:hypothetical protein AX774_g1421 [Zancudomyces culisetae]|uniref:Uncharacterized protein n=1 Tax=Zancudomyces culisetae TaxID=1213189 RepID=A0A1R1PVW8_ZANCU|nr:hypothetical protein AX774_g1421 [Zancudomyces culisetae]|eukprot:OMH85042.1 hypothetical protein AX774_g1421 [Zancudomyces culisetae]
MDAVVISVSGSRSGSGLGQNKTPGTRASSEEEVASDAFGGGDAMEDRDSSLGMGGGSVLPWRLSSNIGSDLMELGNMELVIDRWSELGSPTKLIIMHCLIGLGEKKLGTVKNLVEKIAQLAESDRKNSEWVSITGKLVGRVGVEGTMRDIAALKELMSTDSLDGDEVLIDDLNKSIDKIVNIVHSNIFRLIPKEWRYLSEEIRRSIAPNMTVGSYSGEPVLEMSASANTLEVDNWGLNMYTNPKFAVNHSKRLEKLLKAADDAIATEQQRHQHPAGARIVGGVMGGRPALSAATGVAGMKRPGAGLYSGAGRRHPGMGMGMGMGISAAPGPITIPSDGTSSNLSNTIPTPTNAAPNAAQSLIFGDARGRRVSDDSLRSSPSDSSSSRLFLNPARNPVFGANPITTTQPRNKLGMIPPKKKKPIQTIGVSTSSQLPDSSSTWRRPSLISTTSPSPVPLSGSSPVASRSDPFVIPDDRNDSAAPLHSNHSLHSGGFGGSGATPYGGLQRKSRIQFVDMHDSVALMQERENTMKEIKEKVQEEREAKKLKRKLAIEAKKSTTAQNKRKKKRRASRDSDDDDIEEDDDNYDDQENEDADNQAESDTEESRERKRQKGRDNRSASTGPVDVDVSSSPSEPLASTASNSTNANQNDNQDQDDQDDSDVELAKIVKLQSKSKTQSAVATDSDPSLLDTANATSNGKDKEKAKGKRGRKKKDTTTTTTTTTAAHNQHDEDAHTAEGNTIPAHSNEPIIPQKRNLRSRTLRARNEQEQLDKLLFDSNPAANVETNAKISLDTPDTTNTSTNTSTGIDASIMDKYKDMVDPNTIRQIFDGANVVSDFDKFKILDFLSGKLNRPASSQQSTSGSNDADSGPVDIVLKKSESPDSESSNKIIIEQVIFHMNVGTGEWKMMKKRVKKKKPAASNPS